LQIHQWDIYELRLCGTPGQIERFASSALTMFAKGLNVDLDVFDVENKLRSIDALSLYH
jgi:hypothetical protein